MDELAELEALIAEQAQDDVDFVPPTEGVAEEPEQPVRRRRGRPRKNGLPNVNINVEDAASEEPKRRGRRSSKLSGRDVENAFALCSQFYAGVSGEQHWIIQEQEVRGFSEPMADLLNKIPNRYITAVKDTSGYLIVAVGLYQVVLPRVMMSKALRAQATATANAADEYVQQTGWYSPPETEQEQG